jgi:hypothetical protein
VHPVVIDTFVEGKLEEALEGAVAGSSSEDGNGLRKLEAQVLWLLRLQPG